MPAELHPFVIHFAVGLLLIAPLCDALGLMLRREALLWTGRWTTIIGTVTAILSLLTGLAAQASLGPHSAAGDALLHLHNGLGYVLVLIWLPIAVWRAALKTPLPLRLRTIYLALAITGGVVVTVENFLGAAMVYRHGVGLSAAARAEPAPAQAPAKVKVEKPR